MYFPFFVETVKPFWLRLPRKCLPWQRFHVIALAKLQGTENGFTGSVGADCVQPVLHLHDLQTLSSEWKPLLASSYPWEILGQGGVLLYLNDIAASGHAYVLVSDGQVLIYSHLYQALLLVLPLLCAPDEGQHQLCKELPWSRSCLVW